VNVAANSYKACGGSSPWLVADTVSRIVRARRPKTRYTIGKYIKPLIAVRNWLGHGGFDRLIMSMVR
jgi:hypothetical protein